MRRAIIIAGMLLLACLSEKVLAQEAPYSPTYALADGKELIAVYVGATSCGPCHDPKLKSAIKRMKPLLKHQAEAAGYTFSVTGVALDWTISEGVAFLTSAGPFDEIMVGRSWDNMAAVDYIWADTTSMAAMPQVVLLQRNVENVSGRRVYSEPVLLARYVGAETVADWVETGAPLCWGQEAYGPLRWIKLDCTVR